MGEARFTVPGPPTPKGRPRFYRAGNHVGTYTPDRTAAYEALVQASYRQQCGGTFLEGMIGADVLAYFPIPKRTPKKARAMMEAGLLMHTKLGDADNVAKSVLDALNGIAFGDDRQVCDLRVRKLYAEEPRVEARFWEIGEGARDGRSEGSGA